jgi:hypothetical protein
MLAAQALGVQPQPQPSHDAPPSSSGAGKASSSAPPGAPSTAPVIACEVFPPMQVRSRPACPAANQNHPMNNQPPGHALQPPADAQHATCA